MSLGREKGEMERLQVIFPLERAVAIDVLGIPSRLTDDVEEHRIEVQLVLPKVRSTDLLPGQEEGDPFSIVVTEIVKSTGIEDLAKPIGRLRLKFRQEW